MIENNTNHFGEFYSEKLRAAKIKMVYPVKRTPTLKLFEMSAFGDQFAGNSPMQIDSQIMRFKILVLDGSVKLTFM